MVHAVARCGVAGLVGIQHAPMGTAMMLGGGRPLGLWHQPSSDGCSMRCSTRRAVSRTVAAGWSNSRLTRARNRSGVF